MKVHLIQLDLDLDLVLEGQSLEECQARAILEHDILAEQLDEAIFEVLPYKPTVH